MKKRPPPLLCPNRKVGLRALVVGFNVVSEGVKILLAVQNKAYCETKGDNVEQVRLGRQILGELTFCDPKALNDEALLRGLLERAAAESGATLLSVHVHRFQPQGLSGVAILAESHLTVHTWPEMSYAAVDAFTCGDHVDPARAVQVLEEGFAARSTARIEMNRGMNPSLQALDRLADSHVHGNTR